MWEGKRSLSVSVSKYSASEYLTYLERSLKLGQIATSVPYRLLTLRGCGVSGKEFASFRVV